MIRPTRQRAYSVAISPSAGRCAEGGYVLLLFALFVFGIFALAAVTIDLGLARLAQFQMQDAVDSAALEGLRSRDDSDVTPEQRREAVRELVAEIVAGDPSVDAGVGPAVVFTDGGYGGDLAASQTIDLAESGPFAYPSLELNLVDDPVGDMLSGVYDPDQPHGEESDYSRLDFNSPADPSVVHNAFLVRMRRTRSSGAAPDTIVGVSSSGPALPYLFGRGAAIGASPDYSPRQDQITVRGTAIAAARPATTVGAAMIVPVPDDPEPDAPTEIRIAGVTPFAVKLEFWDLLDTGGCANVPLPAEFPVVQRAVTLGESADELLECRDGLDTCPPDPLPIDPEIHRCVPILAPFGDAYYVVGFGYVAVEVVPGGVEVCRLPSTIAPANATATLQVVLDVCAGCETESDIAPDCCRARMEELFQASTSAVTTVLAPALVKERGSRP